ncbi:MAG: MFS transporter [Armatimonadetes bacterium]|nr:MFS transporter [Armatimonadota bacterium]MBS1710602.1 MFS transporter [Armatimonadota bacterium]MBX3108273.1 MFS transporter [Fimbriimonadaceae bacterium]
MKRGQIPLIAAVALDMTGFGMIIPDIQTRAELFLRAERWSLPPGVTDGVVIGLILASMFIVQFLVSPVWGAKSDHLGRKNVFVACTLLSAGAMAVYALAGTAAMLFASRIIAGLGGANVAVAQASIADSTDGKSRAVGLGYLSAAQSTGLIAGPFIGGVIATAFGSHVLGWVAMGLSVTGVAAVLLWGEFSQNEAVATRRKFGFRPLVREFPKLLPLVLLAGSAWFALATLEGTFGRLLNAVWGLQEFHFGLLFGFESVVGLLVQGLLLKRLVAAFPERGLLWTSYILQGLGLAMTPFVPNLAGLFAASLCYAVGVSVANPTVNGLCSKSVAEDRQGEVFGVLQSARSIGFMLGPLIGGALFDRWHALPYLVAGGVCLLVAFAAPLAVPHAETAPAPG